MRLSSKALADISVAPEQASAAAAARPTPWFSEALVPILTSMLCGRRWHGYANIRNGEAVSDLASDAVIEVAATFEGRDVKPKRLSSPIPPRVLSFLRQVSHADELVYCAWRHREVRLIVDALVEGPHAVERRRARQLAEAILIAAGKGSSS
jgi:alpha-galactosidase/6-phospho-beta-glucosidase family protein